jgi:DNA-binding response OmpR family regulator
LARVLLVEDEPVMAEALIAGLRRCGHLVDVAVDGSEALAKAEGVKYAVVLLDRDLPFVHGDDVCRTLTATGHPARILMLTAAGDVPDRVEGLRLGADDYMSKPFSFEELTARVDALLRRPEARVAPCLTVGDVQLDRTRRTATRGGRLLELTAKEFGLLEVLASNAGAVISAETLLDQVWDENADPFTNAVRVTMVGLRKKLGDPQLIVTLRGVGYRLDPHSLDSNPAADQ